MNPRVPRQARPQGSVLIIVLWIAFGLVSLSLYFGHSMNFELRASDNRVSSQVAEQAIDGAARYINYILTTQISNGSNGQYLDLSAYVHEAVPVGDAHFWILGRDTNLITGPGRLAFGLIDEASKLNLNTLTSNQVIWLPRMTVDFTMGILDWRDTNGNGPTTMYYSMEQPAYLCKSDPFETVDELRLVYGADMDTLVGEDFNRNGVLDPNETDENQNNMLDPGVLEYVTVYSREPNSGGINISNLTSGSALQQLMSTNSAFTSADVTKIINSLGLSSANTPGRSTGTTGAAGRTGAAAAPTTVRFPSPLAFYIKSGMSSSQFAAIATNLITTTNSVITGRVNINTASQGVLTALTGGDTSAAQALVNYRLSNPNNLSSIAWVSDALGQSYPEAMVALAQGDYLTTQSYQYTADIAALGPNGRGYRRVKFVFDTSTGTPEIIYRQDLTHLGWALGAEVRQRWVLAKANQ